MKDYVEIKRLELKTGTYSARLVKGKYQINVFVLTPKGNVFTHFICKGVTMADCLLEVRSMWDVVKRNRTIYNGKKAEPNLILVSPINEVLYFDTEDTLEINNWFHREFLTKYELRERKINLLLNK